MDMYGVSTNDIFHVDDLLDFSNEDIFSSSTTTTTNTHHESDYPPPPPLENTISTTCFSSNTSTTIINPYTTTYTDQLSVPSELDAAELEWVSKLVDDSFTDYPVNELSGNVNLGPDVSSSVVPGKAISRSKRSRLIPAAYLSSWTSTGTSTEPVGNSSASNSSSSPTGRKCTHCQSEKTPQWRTGPMGPKTLCNACGVRYKSGRLVPEYRPAASPTFTLTHHSNSHRKVMELRRQKEVLQKDNNNLRHEYYKVC